MRDGQAIQCLRNEFNLVALNILHYHDLGFGKVVEGKVGHRVSEDGLLYQQHVDSCSFDLLDDLADGEAVG